MALDRGCGRSSSAPGVADSGGCQAAGFGHCAALIMCGSRKPQLVSPGLGLFRFPEIKTPSA
jgi:hypothetical protein